MPAPMLRLHSPSPAPVPDSPPNFPFWEGNSERSHWSFPSPADGQSFQEFQPCRHFLFSLRPCSFLKYQFVLSKDASCAIASRRSPSINRSPYSAISRPLGLASERRSVISRI